MELDKIHIVHIACGYQHSIALSDDGEVYFWGTFHVDIEPVRKPKLIPLENEKIVTCTCSSDSVLLLAGKNKNIYDKIFATLVFNFFLSESGKVFCYGFRTKPDQTKELCTTPISLHGLFSLFTRKCSIVFFFFL